MKINKKYNFEKHMRQVNAGGFNDKSVSSIPYELIFMEMQPSLSGGSAISKLGEVRYSEINPGIDNFLNNIGKTSI